MENDSVGHSASASILASVITLLLTFTWLYYSVFTSTLVDHAGFFVGIYGIFSAFYLQFSSHPKFEGVPLTVKTKVKTRIPITLYLVGAISIFHAIRLTNISATEAFKGSLAVSISNSIAVALITGWLVYVYLMQNTKMVENEAEN